MERGRQASIREGLQQNQEESDLNKMGTLCALNTVVANVVTEDAPVEDPVPGETAVSEETQIETLLQEDTTAVVSKVHKSQPERSQLSPRLCGWLRLLLHRCLPGN